MYDCELLKKTFDYDNVSWRSIIVKIILNFRVISWSRYNKCVKSYLLEKPGMQLTGLHSTQKKSSPNASVEL